MTAHHAMLGWDIGGAHLKAALVDADGHALQVIQVACPLWLGLHELNIAVAKIQDKLSHVPERHALTMTGELADIFPDRESGVRQIAEVMNDVLHCKPHYFAGRHGLIEAKAVHQHLKDIASANWLASATFVAGTVKQGLFIDVGSTTADFSLVAEGAVLNRGFSDAERMQYEELIYTGVVRTPLMAIAKRIPFAGDWQAVAAEHFATTADVYRLTAELSPAEDMADTADGAAKTIHDSARRVARMIGRDLSDAPHPAWLELARSFRQMQLDLLKAAALRQLSRCQLEPDAPLIGAGTGSFLVAALASQLGRPFIEIGSLIKGYNDHSQRWASVCLPAYAVARMLNKNAG
jgi:probable H4MPT-linked C1 transfer pathway protein